MNKEIFKRHFRFKGKYFWKNFLQIGKYISDLKFLLKNGYDRSAVYEPCSWFCNVIVSVLTDFNNNLKSYPILIEDYPITDKELSDEEFSIVEKNRELWHNTLLKMINYASRMDVDTCCSIEEYKNARYNKNEFFKLFNTHFWDLWD